MANVVEIQIEIIDTLPHLIETETSKMAPAQNVTRIVPAVRGAMPGIRGLRIT